MKTVFFVIYISLLFFIACKKEASTPSKSIPPCQLDLLEKDSAYRNRLPIELVVEGRLIGTDGETKAGHEFFNLNLHLFVHPILLNN